MISNQLLQKAIDELKEIAGSEMAVIDLDGTVAVKTYSGKDAKADSVVEFLESSEPTADADGFKLFRIKDDFQDKYVLAVKGTSHNAALIGRMARYQLETLLLAYKERFDKDNFFRSLLLDNLMLVDIYSRSKKLHIDAELRRAVYIVETDSKDQDNAVGTIRNIFVGQAEDFVTTIDKQHIVVIKKLNDGEGYDILEKFAKRMNNALKSDIGKEADIAYGTIISDLKEVSRSYKEAKMALEVGRIFFEDKKINAYVSLGIGRLIYQLPMPLCQLFMKEIFKEGSPRDFDDETLETINKFLDCSLNVSETSRQLFIHRNTLVYRLDKIQKNVGLDLREFDDAITFKIALMVSRYMQYVESLEEK